MILYTEGGTTHEEADAVYVMNVLCTAYPNHPWSVQINQGVLIIKYLGWDNHGWGMIRKMKDFSNDANVFKKSIIMAAGEWLERAGIVRGPGEEAPIVRVEGVPEKHQPVRPEDPPPIKYADNLPERDTVRPQVVR